MSRSARSSTLPPNPIYHVRAHGKQSVPTKVFVAALGRERTRVMRSLPYQGAKELLRSPLLHSNPGADIKIVLYRHDDVRIAVWCEALRQPLARASVLSFVQAYYPPCLLFWTCDTLRLCSQSQVYHSRHIPSCRQVQ